MKRTAKFVLGIALTFTIVAAVSAGFWDWTTPYKGPSKDIATLVMTGNYTKSRLLAELIQAETKQPILLVTKEGGQLFFMPARGSCLEVQDAKFSEFVKFLNPKQIIVLGDTSYVPDSYAKRIDSKQTIIRIDNKDWNEVAVTAGKILDKTNLAYDFKRLSDEIDSGKLYRSGKGTPAPGAVTAPVSTLDPVTKPVEQTKTEEPVLIKDTEVVPK